MKRASNKKKESRSAWVEASGMRGVELTQAPVENHTSPVIPILSLPRAAVKRGGIAAKQGDANSEDREKDEVVPVKKNRIKRETHLVVKQDVKGNEQVPQHIRRRNNDIYPAATGSQIGHIPDQPKKVSVKRRIFTIPSKKKNEEIVMDLIKQNVLENEKLRQKFQQNSKQD